MTEQETSVILGILKIAYPRFYTNLTPGDIKNTVSLWTEMLSDYPLDVVRVAVKKLISELKFPPTIADIRKSLVETTTEQIPDASDAWGKVQKAIRYCGYMQEEKALDSMDETTKQIVVRMGWRQLCHSENQMADRAHFMKLYETFTKETKVQRQIPAEVREQSKLIQNRYSNLNNNIIQIAEKMSV